LAVAFVDKRSIDQGDKWDAAQLCLLYDDTRLPVEVSCTNKYGHTLREGKHELDATSTTLTCRMKVEEITKNHGSRSFRLQLNTGGMTYMTSAFLVQTKRTVSTKQQPVETAGVDAVFKHDAQEVLSMLEWRMHGYERTEDGMPDYERPSYSCPVCQSARRLGHLQTCTLNLLMQR
jgi:hypothetical protein